MDEFLMDLWKSILKEFRTKIIFRKCQLRNFEEGIEGATKNYLNHSSI